VKGRFTKGSEIIQECDQRITYVLVKQFLCENHK
jgi:hypothetical protein